MDAPSSESPPPPPPRPLGFVFWIVLLVPIVLSLVGWSLYSSDRKLGDRLLELAMFAAPVSAVTCAVMVGRRYGAALGLLSLVGILLLYGGVAFAGCVAFATL
jgi:hypothetical protein